MPKETLEKNGGLHMRKRSGIVSLIVLLLLFAIVAVSCAPFTSSEESLVFNDSTKTISGGDRNLNGEINLKDISVQVKDDAATLTFSFVKGSRLVDSAESAISRTPRYTVKILENPRRMQISLYGVDFWDYSTQNLWNSVNLIYGSFDQIPFGETPYTIYFQLASNVEYAVQEKDSQLIIQLKPVAEEGSEQYYVTLNAFDQFEEGQIHDDLGLTPTLCEGNTNVALISSGFDREADAQALLERVNEEIAAVMPAKQAYIQQLTPDQLPKFDMTADTEPIDTRAVLNVDGKPVMLEALMQNASYLTSAPDGSMLFIRKMRPDETIDVEQVTTDTLWLMEPTGKKTQLQLDQSFYSIKDAAYSPDGRYLAILDVTDTQSLLYIWDTKSQKLTNAGEEGFGNITSSFCWSDTKNIIYAMTGYQSLQLMQMDLTTEEWKINSIEEQPGAESDIDFAGGKLYFVDLEASPEGIIYAVDIASGQRSEFTKGIYFQISPDKKTMAVRRYRPTEEEWMPVDVVSINLADGEEQLILSNTFIEQMTFLKDGSLLYLTYGGKGEEFPYILGEWNVSQGTYREYAQITSPYVEADTVNRSLFIVDHIELEDNYVPITYKYEIL